MFNGTKTFHVVTYLPPPPKPCEGDPCGLNAICREQNGVGSCVCKPDYYGDPYTSCQPECLTNSECPLTKACMNTKCVNPCVGACSSVNAECYVVSHKAMCSCKQGFTGDPFDRCSPIPSKRNKTKLIINTET